MKWRIALCALLVLCQLTGCSAGGNTVRCKDLSLALPADFMDLSQESYAEDADLYCGRTTLIVKGLAEEKAGLVDMTLGEFTDYVISSNKLTCAPTPTDYGFVFTYEATVGETPYTYTTATTEGETNFWIIQCYCPSENAAENQADIQSILNSISHNR